MNPQSHAYKLSARSQTWSALRALGAAIVLATLLVGLPAGLWAVGHEWLPAAWPTPQQLGQLFSTPDGGRLLLGALVVIGLGAWAVFAASAALELAARLRHRAAPQIRGMGWAQSIAGVLLTTIVSGLIATSAAAATPTGTAPPDAAPAPPTTSQEAHTPPIQQHAPDHSQTSQRTPDHSGAADDARTYRVKAHDTLWGLAILWYGDGTHYTKILQSNIGRAQPDGTAMRESGQLRPGWTLVVPEDANLEGDATTSGPPAPVREITVKPGDTLSSIAQDTLGDASRYPEIFRANHGVRQSDGGALSAPDLIQPNWTLRVQASAPQSPEQLQPTPATPPTPPPPKPADPQNPTAEKPPPATLPSTTPTSVNPTGATNTPRDLPGTPAHVPDPAPQRTHPAPADTTPGRVGDAEVLTLPTALTVSAVLAAALGGGLVQARRRQLRRRRADRQAAAPSAGAARVERALSAAANAADLEFVDLALRSLAAQLAAEGRPDDIPDVLCGWLDATGLRLTLAIPRTDPPPPFLATDTGLQWYVPVDAVLPVTAETAAEHLAPLPTLVSVGHTGNRQLLLDLEGLRAVQLSGDDTKGTDLLRHLAAELAHNRWSDGLDVLLVGFGAELTAINPDRIRHIETLEAASAALRRRLAGAHQIITESEAHSALHGRINDIVGDAWMPEVLLVAEPRGAEQTPSENTSSGFAALLAELAQSDRSIVAVVTSDTDAGPDALVMNLDLHGELRVPELTEEILRAEGISADLAPHVVELFAAAHAPDTPIPAAPEPQPWAHDMNAAGGLLTSRTSPQEPAATTAAATQAPDNPPQPSTTDERPGVGAPPDHARNLVTFTPRTSEAQQRLDTVLSHDPDLDRDLAAWHDQHPSRPHIAVLGEVHVTAPGIAPAQRMQWYTEVLVYLALHPAGVHPAKLVDDLWNGTAVKAVTYRQVMSAARKWAGQHPDGDDNLTHLIGGTPYQLRDFQLDWALFRRLRKRAQAKAATGSHHQAAMDDYRAALGLVRGPVLTNLRPGGYNWLANPDQCLDRNLPGFIGDTAHELVELALTADDPDTATWAATTARHADAHRTEDQPLLDLMLIAHHTGDHSALTGHAQLLVTEAGVELPEDLPPRVYQVFNQLLPHGLRMRPGA